MNHRPGATLSAGSQTVLPTVRFSPATTVVFTTAANIVTAIHNRPPIGRDASEGLHRNQNSAAQFSATVTDATRNDGTIGRTGERCLGAAGSGTPKRPLPSDIYAHILPGTQQEAAAILGTLLAEKMANL